MNHQLRIRSSAVGRLMTEPKSKAEGPLSKGAKTFIRELAAQDIFGIDFEVSSREMTKGINCEGESIALFNSVFGRELVKNTVRKTDEHLTGEADLLDSDEVVDIKTAWSAATFPLSEDDIADTQRKLYEWQLRAYCRLWNKPRGRIAYCLVSTPDDLIGYEPMQLHMVDHIPEHMRVTSWTVDRDAVKEADMVQKIIAARAYYAEVIEEFDRTHRAGNPIPPAYAEACRRSEDADTAAALSAVLSVTP
jgi:hypothetical protein